MILPYGTLLAQTEGKRRAAPAVCGPPDPPVEAESPEAEGHDGPRDLRSLEREELMETEPLERIIQKRLRLNEREFEVIRDILFRNMSPSPWRAMDGNLA
jgi:hypothetical protein